LRGVPLTRSLIYEKLAPTHLYDETGELEVRKRERKRESMENGCPDNFYC
jgi:hypothetical protein